MPTGGFCLGSSSFALLKSLNINNYPIETKHDMKNYNR